MSRPSKRLERLLPDRQALLRRYEQVQRGAVYFTGASIMVICVLLVTNVLLRFTDFTGIWVAGLAKILLVFVVFLPLGFLELEDEHIRVNYFYNRSPPVVRRFLDYGDRLLGLVVIVAVLVSSVQALQLFGDRTSPSGLPSVLIFVPAVVGMVSLGVEYTRRLVNQLRSDLW